MGRFLNWVMKRLASQSVRVFGTTLILSICLVTSVHFLLAFGSKIQNKNSQIHFVDQVLPKYKDKFVLHYPKQMQLTSKPTIMVKGVNRLLTPVFVNGKRVSVREDGRFYHKLHVSNPGKYTVFVSFISPDQEIIHLKRKVIRVLPVPTSGVNVRLKESDMAFFNTHFVPQYKISHDINGYVNRRQLAYFIARLKHHTPTSVKTDVFRDVSPDLKGASDIQFVTYEQIMSEYPTGEFKPFSAIKKMEYVISLVKAYDYQLNRKGNRLPYRDARPAHWSYKYIRAAFQEGLIPEADELRLNKKLSQFRFYLLAKRIPEVRKAIQDVMDYDIGFDVSESQKDTLNKKVLAFTKKKKKPVDRNQTLRITSPKEDDVILSDFVMIKGRIVPPQSFKINAKDIIPNVDGKFVFKYPLKPLKNTLLISTYNEKKTVTVWRLKSFSDMNGHWFAKKAAQLKQAKLLPEKSKLRPDRLISRAVFAKRVVKLFNLQSKPQETISFLDVSPNLSTYQQINVMVDNRILTASKSGRFQPKRIMTKLEAIVAIMRLGQYPELDADTLASVRLPYQDVARYRWAQDYLKSAYYYKLIHRSNKLHPKKKLTKADLLSLLYKTPRIQKRLAQTFR